MKNISKKETVIFLNTMYEHINRMPCNDYSRLTVRKDTIILKVPYEGTEVTSYQNTPKKIKKFLKEGEITVVWNGNNGELLIESGNETLVAAFIVNLQYPHEIVQYYREPVTYGINHIFKVERNLAYPYFKEVEIHPDGVIRNNQFHRMIILENN